MDNQDKFLRELRVDGNKILINKFKEELQEVAQNAFGIDANDLISEDYDIFVALSERETPNQFAERVREKHGLDTVDGFQFPKIYRVQAEMISYCYLDVEALNEEEANQIAEDTDGGDFSSDDDPFNGEWNILKSLTQVAPPPKED